MSDPGAVDQQLEGDRVTEDHATSRAVLAQIVRCRNEVKRRLAEAESSSTREILAVGNKVSDIVDAATGSIEVTRASVGQKLTSLMGTIEEFSRQTEEMIRTQSNNVDAATGMIKDIVDAGKKIEKLAKSARTITLNAHIMAASLGESGKRVGVLAHEMKAHSEQIETRVAAISELTEQLLGTLPKIVDCSEEFRRGSQGIGNRICQTEQESTHSFQAAARASNDTINKIVNMAYSALAHLQFHEPHMQLLQGIDTLLFQLVDNLADQLGVELEQEPPMNTKPSRG